MQPTIADPSSQSVAALVLTALRAAVHPGTTTPGGELPPDVAPRPGARAAVSEAATSTPLTMPSSTAEADAVSPVALAEGIAEATGSAFVTDLRVVRGRAGGGGRMAPGAPAAMSTAVPADGVNAEAPATRPANTTTTAGAGPATVNATTRPAVPSVSPSGAPPSGAALREARHAGAPREARSGGGLELPLPAGASEPASGRVARASVPTEPVVVAAPDASVESYGPSRRGRPEARPAVAAGPSAGPEVPEARQELPLRDMEPAERRERHAPDAAPASAQATAAPASLSPAATARGERAGGTAAGREARDVPYSSPPKEQAAGSADRVTLAVTDDAGRQTRIRVAVLGEQVRATIVPPDGDSARQLERRMDDLTAALVRQGYADPKVTVQVAGDAGPAWGGAAGAAATDTTAARGTDQPAGQERQGSGRREPDRQAGQEQRQSHQRGRQRDPEDRRR